MADKAHDLIDKKLEEMERHLSAIYSRAGKEVWSQLDEFVKPIKKESEKIIGAYRRAETAEEKKKAKNDYFSFVRKLEKTKKFKNVSNKISQSFFQINKEASEFINSNMPYVYAVNFNAISNSIGKETRYSLITVTEAEALEYSNFTQQNIDEGKDKEWNQKTIKTSFISGAILMLSISAIAKRAAKIITQKNRDSARLHAQDITTDAESKGREDAMYCASDFGIRVQKRWLSTLDSRTRDSHRKLDGKTIDLNDDFLPDLSRPRDPHGPLPETCNCRCTLEYFLPGISRETATRVARDADVHGSYKNQNSFTGTKTINVPFTNYPQWAKWRQNK